jgi:hypothetical protein
MDDFNYANGFATHQAQIQNLNNVDIFKRLKQSEDRINELEKQIANLNQETDIANRTHKKTLSVALPRKKWIGLTQSEIEEIYMRNTKEGGVCNGLSIALEVQHMLKEKNHG